MYLYLSVAFEMALAGVDRGPGIFTSFQSRPHHTLSLPSLEFVGTLRKGAVRWDKTMQGYARARVRAKSRIADSMLQTSCPSGCGIEMVCNVSAMPRPRYRSSSLSVAFGPRLGRPRAWGGEQRPAPGEDPGRGHGTELVWAGRAGPAPQAASRWIAWCMSGDGPQRLPNVGNPPT